MDITYLLWFQDFRNAIGDALTPFVEALSFFAISWLLLVPFTVYWCISKKNGLFLITAFCISWMINGIVKLTVCAYRPWIRDARIIPAGDSIKTAGGYSFPSGHTMNSSPIYGGLAVLAKKRAAWFSWLCILAIIVTALSRNYLGVHTPQDVLVGTILGLCSVWLASKIIAKPESENFMMIAGLVLCVIAYFYITKKSYPMDYKDGKLVVDPVKMLPDTFNAIGMMAGFIIGRYLEREYVKFESTGFSIRGILLALVGGAVFIVLLMNSFGGWKSLHDPLIAVMPAHWVRFTFGAAEMFFAMFVWPLVIKLTEGRK